MVKSYREQGDSVVKWSDHLPFTSKVLSLIPSKVYLDVDSNPFLK